MNFKKTLFTVACAAAIFSSCKKDEPDPTLPVVEKDFQLSFASGSGSNSATYLQGATDLTTGEITFSGKGYQMPSARTARIFVSNDGSTVYNLNYTVGTIDKYIYSGGENYTPVGTPFDASIPLGVKAVRFTKLNDQAASVHNIAAVAQYNDASEYTGHKMTLSIGILNLETMNFGTNFNKEIDLKLPGTLGQEGYNIGRIDCPVISGNKLYYGASVNKFNTTTGTNGATDRVFTVVLDYPSLANPTVIESTVAKGSTNGYRTQTQYVDETGDILQMVSSSDGNNLGIVKIRNGQYITYKFDISQALGRKAASNGWFYVGNGIGYMPYEKIGDAQVQIGVNPSGEPTYSSAWGLMRIDLNAQTVVDLETPANLWLQQYQTSVARDGKFYIALAPVGEQGYIYIYDVNSTSSKGTQGAKITAGADQYYIGIY